MAYQSAAVYYNISPKNKYAPSIYNPHKNVCCISYTFFLKLRFSPLLSNSKTHLDAHRTQTMPVLTNRSKLLCHNRRCLLCSIFKMRITSRHPPSTCSLNTLWMPDGRVCTLDWGCQARPSRHDTVSGISNRPACGNLVANMKRMRAYLDFCAALGCMRNATDMYTLPVRLWQRLLEGLACR